MIKYYYKIRGLELKLNYLQDKFNFAFGLYNVKNLIPLINKIVAKTYSPLQNIYSTVL